MLLQVVIKKNCHKTFIFPAVITWRKLAMIMQWRECKKASQLTTAMKDTCLHLKQNVQINDKRASGWAGEHVCECTQTGENDAAAGLAGKNPAASDIGREGFLQLAEAEVCGYKVESQLWLAAAQGQWITSMAATSQAYKHRLNLPAILLQCTFSSDM